MSTCARIQWAGEAWAWTGTGTIIGIADVDASLAVARVILSVVLVVMETVDSANFLAFVFRLRVQLRLLDEI